jgi:hypothetical protein
MKPPAIRRDLGEIALIAAPLKLSAGESLNLIGITRTVLVTGPRRHRSTRQRRCKDLMVSSRTSVVGKRPVANEHADLERVRNHSDIHQRVFA